MTKASHLAHDLVARFETSISIGELPPGSRFPTEQQIAHGFGVSRTVVREAFARLSAQGLIVSRRGAGAFVADYAQYRAFQIVPDEIADASGAIKFLEMCRGLQIEMTELAALRRSKSDLAVIHSAVSADTKLHSTDKMIKTDMAFHDAVALACGNDTIIRFYNFMKIRIAAIQKNAFKVMKNQDRRNIAYSIASEHHDIYDAVARGDALAAKRAAHRHVNGDIERFKLIGSDANVYCAE